MAEAPQAAALGFPGAPPPAQPPAGQEPLPAVAAGLGGGGGSSLGDREAPAGPGALRGRPGRRVSGRKPLVLGGRGGEGRGRTVGCVTPGKLIHLSEPNGENNGT
ncbi:myosin heavy chain IB-like [Prionailurus viverrinus]|uniref:myosin heavy chain IB-like n=1 Tax=Prionailurus viverrinus TaxID=61388 RepID=UPI001FF62C75|nr:myosin heavy chain IB-like [Prionailurus viverrinus]